MALEVFPQELFGYGFKDLYNLLGGGSNNFMSYCESGVEEEEEEICGLSGLTGEIINYNEKKKKQETESSSPSVLLLNGNGNNNTNWDSSNSSLMVGNVKEQETNSSSETYIGDGLLGFQQINEDPVIITTSNNSGRRKRRRTKTCKNKEEVENQRMTHIAVERNRRRQMNEYLTVLRSLMPPSYIQRGDQASIIGGAINFVKELEQLLQSLESQKQVSNRSSSSIDENNIENFKNPFADFFTFPQYSSHSSSSSSTQSNNNNLTSSMAATSTDNNSENHHPYGSIADIEVTMVESHANLKILTKTRSKQLLKLVSQFQTLRLTILHLNVTTTVHQMVLYSFSVKVEEDCQLTSVDEIATAVYQMLGRIQDEEQ